MYIYIHVNVHTYLYNIRTYIYTHIIDVFSYTSKVIARKNHWNEPLMMQREVLVWILNLAFETSIHTFYCIMHRSAEWQKAQVPQCKSFDTMFNPSTEIHTFPQVAHILLWIKCLVTIHEGLIPLYSLMADLSCMTQSFLLTIPTHKNMQHSFISPNVHSF